MNEHTAHQPRKVPFRYYYLITQEFFQHGITSIHNKTTSCILVLYMFLNPDFPQWQPWRLSWIQIDYFCIYWGSSEPQQFLHQLPFAILGSRLNSQPLKYRWIWQQELDEIHFRFNTRDARNFYQPQMAKQWAPMIIFPEVIGSFHGGLFLWSSLH